MAQREDVVRRVPLSRERVLRAAVALADDAGIDAVSMRKLAQELGVVPMALYKHVANKDELLDGMVDVVVGEIDPPVPGADWKTAVRQRILSARRALLRHPWASRRDRVAHRADAGRAGVPGLDDRDVPGRRLLRRPHPSRDARAGQPHVRVHPGAVRRPGRRRPGSAGRHDRASWRRRTPTSRRSRRGAAHDDDSVVGPGCDDQFEFEFALDLLLDGFDRLHRQGWSSSVVA